MIDFETLQAQSHKIAVAHGWWDGEATGAEREHFLRLYEEIGEAWRCWRRGDDKTITVNGKPLGLPAELADIVIVAMNMAAHFGIDLATEILRKHRYNTLRPHRHGDAR